MQTLIQSQLTMLAEGQGAGGGPGLGMFIGRLTPQSGGGCTKSMGRMSEASTSQL
jgi:hypothetical protein